MGGSKGQTVEKELIEEGAISESKARQLRRTLKQDNIDPDAWYGGVGMKEYIRRGEEEERFRLP